MLSVKWLMRSAIFIFVIMFGFKLWALFSLPISGDELDDFRIAARDLNLFSRFFEGAMAVDQSRWPHMLTWPLIPFVDINDIFIYRLPFFLIHCLTFWIYFEIGKIFFKDHVAAILFFISTTTACFLSAFGIFATTTSDSLYLLFHALTMWTILKWGFSRFFLLTVVLAGCLSSKLFGGLLLISSFLFYFFLQASSPQTLVVAAETRSKVVQSLRISVLFLAVLAALNVSSLELQSKMITAFALSGFYLIAFAFLSLSKENKSVEGTIESSANDTSPFLFWSSLGLTTLSLVLITSPIYLNLQNVVRSTNWFSTWNKVTAFGETHWTDISMILIDKYGWIPSALLFGVLVFYLVAFLRKTWRPSRDAIFLIFVFAIGLLGLSMVNYKVTWYPLALAPLLPLPVISLFQRFRNTPSKASSKTSILKTVFIGAVFTLIVTDNLARYAYWYPYAHLDGAQLGPSHAGFTKSAMVSFEYTDDLLNLLVQDVKRKSKVTLVVRVSALPGHRSYTADLLKTRARKFEIQNGIAERSIVILTELPIGPSLGSGSRPDFRTIDYILVSPTYNLEQNEGLFAMGWTTVKKFETKGLATALLLSSK